MENLMKKSVITWIFLTALALIFIVAKLYGVINWSWLLVISPLWGPITICFLTGSLAFIFAFLFTMIFKCLFD